MYFFICSKFWKLASIQITNTLNTFSQFVVYLFSHFCRTVFFFFLIDSVGFELRALCLLGRPSYHLSYSTSLCFAMSFFEIGSCELFAQSGFKP
jgi:hypothetical protein